MATFGPAMSKVTRFRKTSVVLFSDRIKGTASTLACIVLDRSLEAIENAYWPNVFVSKPFLNVLFFTIPR